MAKDRAVNPAHLQHKLDKQKAQKKGKAEIQARRNEKLARRNPFRIQRQIDNLKALEDSGQPLRPKDRQVLDELEKQLKAVKKAKEVLGDRIPEFNTRHDNDRATGQHKAVLGKRRRQYENSDSDSTDESVKDIPMPRDTPPVRSRHQDKQKPDIVAKTVYEATPVVRDLRKEAVSQFIPTAVQRKQNAVKGQGQGQGQDSE